MLDFDVALTDKFPNANVASRLTQNHSSRIRYAHGPIDATCLPSELTGFRTIFTSFHHFTRERGRSIIRNSVAHQQPIGIFEFTVRQPRALALMLLLPLAVWG